MNLEKNDIPFSICDAAATNQYVNNLTVSVQPNPIVIKPEKQISLDIGFDLLKEIPIGSRISLKLKKDDWIDIPIPCLKVWYDNAWNIGLLWFYKIKRMPGVSTSNEWYAPT